MQPGDGHVPAQGRRHRVRADDGHADGMPRLRRARAAVRDALHMATRWTLVADRLELRDGNGTRLAAFFARSQTSVSSELEGTSWQLVKFQRSDKTTRTPDAREKHTIELGHGGRLTACIDCNRGRGTWTSSGPNQIQFGPLALRRAKCPAGSMHDHIVRQWASSART